MRPSPGRVRAARPVGGAGSGDGADSGAGAAAVAGGCLLACLLACLAPPAAAQDLEAALSKVGEEYARGYLAPMVSALGTAQLAGLSTTAAIPDGRLRATLGLRGVAVGIAAADREFRQVRRVILDESFGFPPDHELYGREGFLVTEGPTVFGSEDRKGRATAYLEGIPLYSEPTIAGLLDTRWPGLVVPEVSLAGLAHLRATLRWLPKLALGEVAVSLLGGGVAWGLADVYPRAPVDLAVGLFWQRVRVDGAVEADAVSGYLTASRRFGLLTCYGSVAMEDSRVDADYTYVRGDLRQRIAFTMHGEQDARFTVGATVNGGGAGPQLNLEAAFHTLTTLSAALLAGF